MIKPSTFSIAASDPEEGSCGIAVASKFLAAGSVVPWAQAKAGAIATQSYANTRYGPIGIKMLEKGMSAESTLKSLLAGDHEFENRQVGIVDMKGGSATFTGKLCHEWAGGIQGDNYAVQGNILVGKQVICAMAQAFENSTRNLTWRLFSALQAGDQVGGDRRGRQSAAIIVVKSEGGYAGFNDRLVDLRVDDHNNPVNRLGELIKLHALYFGKSPEEDEILLEGNDLIQIQALMKKFGYYHGKEHGIYDHLTQDAFISFIGNENFEDRCNFISGKIDRPVFEYLKAEFIKKQL